MILFIDTEWADVLANELVSLALVSDCGQYEFYAEREPLPTDCTDFVRSVIYPLLDRAEHALGDAEFTQQLHEFIGRMQAIAKPDRVSVAFDHRNDMDLFSIALEGFNLPETPPRPAFIALDLEPLGKAFQEAVDSCFAKDPEIQARRHHALVDARANRDAYLSLQRGDLSKSR